MKWLIYYEIDDYNMVKRYYSGDRRYADTDDFRKHIRIYRVYDLDTNKTRDVQASEFERLVKNKEIWNASWIDESDFDIYDSIHNNYLSYMAETTNRYANAKWSNILIDSVHLIAYQYEHKGRKIVERKEAVHTVGYTRYGLVAIDYNGNRKILDYDVLSEGLYKSIYLVHGISKDDIQKIGNTTSFNDIKKILNNYTEINLSAEERLRIENIQKQNNIASITCGEEYRVDGENRVYINEPIRNLVLDRCTDIIFKSNTYESIDLFRGCSCFSIQRGLKVLPDMTLAEARELNVLHLPSDLVQINVKCITHTSLKKIDLSHCTKLECIKHESLSHNNNLKELIYPDNIVELAECGYDNPKVEELILPYKCDYMTNKSFIGMSGLKRLGLPGVATIASGNPKYYAELTSLEEIWTPKVNIEFAKKIKRYAKKAKIIVSNRVIRK